jgi:hypothetical protein
MKGALHMPCLEMFDIGALHTHFEQRYISCCLVIDTMQETPVLHGIGNQFAIVTNENS